MVSKTLLYIYAGKREEGWEIFDRHYPLEDKELLRKTLRETLEKEPIYQEICGKEHTAPLNTVLCSSQRNGTRIGSKK